MMNILLGSVIDILEAVQNIHQTDNEHGTRTSMMAIAIGKRLKLAAGELQLLDYAARIHDLGWAGVDDYIVAKKGRLTVAQRSGMQAHPKIGYELVKHKGLPIEIENTILRHHEHWDSSGYPDGLIGLDIPLYARIVCIADAWDAIMSERPYHKARTHEQALEEMNRSADWFDPKLYVLFLSILKEQANERP